MIPQFVISYSERVSRRLSQNRYIHEIGLFVVCALFLGFALHHLGQFISVDEEKWLYVRIRQLYLALASGDFARTYINDKPGILPSLLAGIVMNFTDVKHYNPVNVENFLFWWRLPIVLFNLALILVMYKLLKHLFDKTAALIITAIIAGNPTLIGMSQIVNPDATLWSTCACASLSFLLFIKSLRVRYVFLCSLFLALALISKFAATYFFLAFFVISVGAYVQGLVSREKFKTLCLGWLAVLILSSLGYYLLFPAAWFSWSILWRGTLGCDIIHPVLRPFAALVLLFTIEASLLKGRPVAWIQSKLDLPRHLFGVLGLLLFSLLSYVIIRNFADASFFGSLKKGYRGGAEFLPSLFANTFVFLSTISTVTLLGLIALSVVGIAQWFRKTLYQRIESPRHLTLIFVLGISYILGTSLTGFYASSRYQMLTFPFYAAAAGLAYMSLSKRHGLTFLLVVSLSFLEILEVSPFYFCFSNRINIRNEIITEAWGFGGYEAAKWAAARFDGDNTKIWFDREGFSQFSNNDVYRWNKKPWEIKGLDYLVLTTRGRMWAEGARKGLESRWLYGPLLEYYDKPPEFEVRVGGNPKNFVRIVAYDRSEMKQVLASNAARADNGLGYLDLRRAASMSFWIKSGVETPGAPLRIDGSFNSALGIESRRDFDRGGLRFRYASNGAGSVLTTGRIHDGKWHHVVWYQKGGTIGSEWGLFVDGKLVSKAQVPVKKSGTPIVRLKEFEGEMEDFEIFERAVSENEVAEIYGTGRIDKVSLEDDVSSTKP